MFASKSNLLKDRLGINNWCISFNIPNIDVKSNVNEAEYFLNKNILSWKVKVKYKIKVKKPYAPKW
jgi:hypothetical protein